MDEEAIRARRALRVRVQYRLEHYDPKRWDDCMRKALAACRIYNGNTVMLLPPTASQVWNHLLGGQHPRIYSFGIPGHADTIEKFGERKKGVLVSLHEKGVELARRLPAICVLAWIDYPFDHNTDFFVQASRMVTTGHRENSVVVFVDPSVFPEVQSVMEDVVAGA